MNTPLFAMLGWPEIMGIIVVVLILFGAKKVPELMRGLGKGINEFKRATRDVQEDLQRAIEEDPPLPPAKKPSQPEPPAAQTEGADTPELEHSTADSPSTTPRA